MTLSLHSVTYWLPPFLVISSCVWILLSGRMSGSEKNTSGGPPESGSESETTAPPTVHVMQKIKKGRYIASLMLTPAAALTLGIFIGYEIRDHQFISNTRTYLGVSVLAQLDERRYTVHIPGYSRPYDWEFCHPLKMPSPLVDIKYEQRYGCKTVNGVGFVSVHNEEKNNARIQNGRDSTATAETTARLEGR